MACQCPACGQPLPVEAPEKVAIRYPTYGAVTSWALTEAQVEAWQVMYPSVDVLAECLRALAWLQANTRKTAKGMPRFLVSWLSRATDAPQGRGYGFGPNAARIEPLKRMARAELPIERWVCPHEGAEYQGAPLPRCNGRGQCEQSTLLGRPTR